MDIVGPRPDQVVVVLDAYDVSAQVGEELRRPGNSHAAGQLQHSHMGQSGFGDSGRWVAGRHRRFFGHDCPRSSRGDGRRERLRSGLERYRPDPSDDREVACGGSEAEP